MARTINAAGLALIKHFEGCRLTAYQDIAGIWTIGYGHTGGVTDGMVITQDQADLFLQEDLQGAAGAVDAAVEQTTTSDNQFAAMVSLCYNIGPRAFKSSTMLRQHRAGATATAANAFLMWSKSTIDGELHVVQGLLDRRQAERGLYLT